MCRWPMLIKLVCWHISKLAEACEKPTGPRYSSGHWSVFSKPKEPSVQEKKLLKRSYCWRLSWQITTLFGVNWDCIVMILDVSQVEITCVLDWIAANERRQWQEKLWHFVQILEQADGVASFLGECRKSVFADEVDKNQTGEWTLVWTGYLLTKQALARDGARYKFNLNKQALMTPVRGCSQRYANNLKLHDQDSLLFSNTCDLHDAILDRRWLTGNF